MTIPLCFSPTKTLHFVETRYGCTRTEFYLVYGTKTRSMILDQLPIACVTNRWGSMRELRSFYPGQSAVPPLAMVFIDPNFQHRQSIANFWKKLVPKLSRDPPSNFLRGRVDNWQ